MSFETRNGCAGHRIEVSSIARARGEHEKVARFDLGEQTGRAAIAIIAGVLIVTAIGEPVRRFRLRHTTLRPVVGD